MSTVVHHDTRAGLPTAIWSDWSCTVRLVVTDVRVLERATTDVITLMNQVERAASRFTPESEISRANRLAGRPVPVSRTLADLVAGALAGAELTGGAVDPTVGQHLVRLGYDRDILLMGGPGAEDSEAASAPSAAGAPTKTWRDVRLDRETGLLTVPVGTALDLGSTAKAQTTDWAAAAAHARYGCDVLVEIGGDLAVAGSRPGWQVTVAEREGEAGQQIGVLRGGLATSTTTVRRWQHAGRPAHHIVDPATGQPANGPWRTASVAADTAFAANVHSTAAIVKGEGAKAWLDRRGVAARLVDRDGLVTRLNGWPAEDLTVRATGFGSASC
jgi:FAD:protein FMN transferase